ncbi:TPA: DUF5514 family protein [Bacillus cytotoxicus]|nr:DUF5514 family protein [Bacillus cytotoxicus]
MLAKIQTLIPESSIGYLLHIVNNLVREEKQKYLNMVIDQFHKKREGLNDIEIMERGLNVYSDQGILVSQLLGEAVKRKLILLHEDEEELYITLTEQGKSVLGSFYTDGFCEDFKCFNERVINLFRKHRELELDPFLIQYFYWNGSQSIDEIEEEYIKDFDYFEENDRKFFHSYLADINFEGLSAEEYIFHFTPKLLLPEEWSNENVKLEVDGIELPKDLVLNRPYPNSRYVVAGFDKEGLTSHGFYWLKKKEDLNNQTISISLRWFIGANKIIIHNLDLQFNFGEHKGNFFSSCQQLNRGTKIEQFEITTKLPVDNSDIDNHHIFNEKFTLTHFPIERHVYFGADHNMGEWESRRARMEIVEKGIKEVHYSITSSAELNWEDENIALIRELVIKKEPFFITRDDDYGECFEMNFTKPISEEQNEEWIIDKVIEFYQTYGITELELWKTYGEHIAYAAGVRMVIQETDDGTYLDMREVYVGFSDDWNFLRQ